MHLVYLPAAVPRINFTFNLVFKKFKPVLNSIDSIKNANLISLTLQGPLGCTWDELSCVQSAVIIPEI
jgi:hypothetical protein